MVDVVEFEFGGKVYVAQINNVKGTKFYDDKPCEYTRGYVCKGNHFESKISVWSKFVSLFKHK